MCEKEFEDEVCVMGASVGEEEREKRKRMDAHADEERWQGEDGPWPRVKQPAVCYRAGIINYS